jgi:senataxin
MDRESPKKILLCAPSNAAIDEVAHRIKESRIGSGPPIKVVRLGSDKSINISVKDISLDYLVEQKMNANQDQKGASTETGNETTAVRTEIEAVKRMKQQKLEELSTIHDNLARSVALEEEIKKLNSRRMTLTQQFDKLKDKRKSEFRSIEATRRKIRAEVLYEADVICSTLSGAGHETVEPFDFEMVIIDEAAQAIELSSLIPLKFRCKRCIMVGGMLNVCKDFLLNLILSLDPQQLPPTVLSQEVSLCCSRCL